MTTPADDWSHRSRTLSALLARAGVGDRAAFAALYRATSSHLYAVVLRINRDRAEAEEVLQEVYVSLWRAAGGYDAAQGQPLTWMTSIARNRAIDSLRRRQTQPRLQSTTMAGAIDDDEGDHDMLDDQADDAPGPLALLTRAAEAHALTACLEQLSSPQRQSVALAFYDGLSHSEVAARMREPLGTVKSWVRRALHTLRGCLDRAGIGGDIDPPSRGG